MTNISRTIGMGVFASVAVLTVALASVGRAAEYGTGPAAFVVRNTSVSLSPTRTFIAPNETCTISVRVTSSGDSLGCIECWVSFDTSLVSIELAEEGTLFKTAPYPRLFFWQHIAPDTQSVEGCLLGYGTFAASPGEIARYTFKAKKNGTCPVRITRLNLFDIRRVMYQPVMDPNAWIMIGSTTGIESPTLEGASLECYPNPFNPTTTIVLRLPGADSTAQAGVSIGVYSPDGRMVRELFDGTMTTGEKRFVWDGKDAQGEEVTSGVYFAVAKTENGTCKTKLVLVR